MQNMAYYVNYWYHKDGPTKTCGPFLLMEVLGQEMGLSAAVWACGCRPGARPLSPNIPCLLIPADQGMFRMQRRLCRALQIGTCSGDRILLPSVFFLWIFSPVTDYGQNGRVADAHEILSLMPFTVLLHTVDLFWSQCMVARNSRNRRTNADHTIWDTPTAGEALDDDAEIPFC